MTEPRQVQKIRVAGEWVSGQAGSRDKVSKRDGRVLATVEQASVDQVRQAIDAAHTAFRTAYRRAPSYLRAELLARISQEIGARADTFAVLMAEEVGKPRDAGLVEADRARTTFQIAAEEAKRQYGEVLPLDLLRGSEDRIGIALRQPIGVVAAITPFNFPLNLVAHKVAPALAAGCSVVLRPTTEAPLTALMLGDIIARAIDDLRSPRVPQGIFNVVPCSTDAADALLTSECVAMVSFTGSGAVGEHIRARAGKKRVALELGSNSANIVTPSADLAQAASALARGGFTFAGQSCISAQRLYVHEQAYDAFMRRLVEAAEAMVVGDPLEPGVAVGPMISEEAAQRAERWIQQAVETGARVETGGRREGAYLWPTVLSGVTRDMLVVCEEVFAPVVAVQRYTDFPQVVEEANQAHLGLNYGVFTHDLTETLYAIEELEVGAVIINDASTYRADHMPYGGVKDSGVGREGLRYAMQEMTELKFAVIAPDFTRYERPN